MLTILRDLVAILVFVIAGMAAYYGGNILYGFLVIAIALLASTLTKRWF